ncbi:MlaE family lipid ABC transporter permease subunit [Chitinispirillales bacterium ANBcel5]|uniref:ABC transporter permease n=1 Tax=Cellulosispirillum alkaliphilum TaxID=3039283 RepID=UPI002A5027A7|nr:MlaE family lipid ABC transporter permease subunit [Chitinispirillales bacterium ANBcel5]
MKLTPKDEKVIKGPPFLDRTWVESCGLLKGDHSNKTTVDLSQTRKIDSSGICFLRLLHSLHTLSGGKLVLKNAPPNIVKELNSSPEKSHNPTPAPKPGYFYSVGDRFIKSYQSCLKALSVLVEMLYWGTIGTIKRRDIKKGALGEQMYQLGFKALGIITLLSFLVGVVLALQTAMQLKNFGAGVFLAPLIGITMVREMGPLLTAIILAGRTGSATTAEIATMGVGEELEALQTMGINPVQFVVVPKFWAITITMPLLSALATAAGIFGGYLIGLVYLDITSALFWSELLKHLHFRDVLAGVSKSFVFAWLIIWIGAYYGFKVKGGAEAVGKETTASVVAGIFVIVVTDAIFSFII